MIDDLNKNQKSIDLTDFELSKFEIKGSDIRNHILKQNNDVVKLLLEKMKDGFSNVLVKQEDKESIKDILHFLCILPYVNIMVK